MPARNPTELSEPARTFVDAGFFRVCLFGLLSADVLCFSVPDGKVAWHFGEFFDSGFNSERVEFLIRGKDGVDFAFGPKFPFKRVLQLSCKVVQITINITFHFWLQLIAWLFLLSRFCILLLIFLNLKLRLILTLQLFVFLWGVIFFQSTVLL